MVHICHRVLFALQRACIDKIMLPQVVKSVHKLFTMMESPSRMRFFCHAENSLSVQ